MSFLNWGLESIKWLIVLPKNNNIVFLQSYRSVLIGLGMSILMPRIAGESIGRYTSHQGNKKDVISALLLTKIAQTMITFFFGVIGIIYYQTQLSSWFHLPSNSFYSLSLVVLLVFFLFRKKLKKLALTNAYLETFRQMDSRKTLKLLFISLLRYLTFFGQFYIMCLYIDIQVDWINLFFALSTLFFIRMATISINIVIDLGVRFTSALLVFSTLNVIPDPNAVIVIFSLVWLFNVIIPSLLGGLLIMKNK